MFELHFLCVGLRYSPHTVQFTAATRQRDLLFSGHGGDGRWVRLGRLGGGEESLRYLLTPDHHIQVSQLLQTEPTRWFFPKLPTFHSFNSNRSCDLLLSEDVNMSSGRHK